MNRFFIALLPPKHVQEYAHQIQQHFATNYASSGALNSPPHITLQPPFVCEYTNILLIEQALKEFAQHQQPVPIILNGFAAFSQHVIYIDVVKSPELINLQSRLLAYMKNSWGIYDAKSQNHRFTPHITVAFRDLTRENFQAAWPIFQQRQVNFEFTATNLTLLHHDGRLWCVQRDFPFSATDFVSLEK